MQRVRLCAVLAIDRIRWWGWLVIHRVAADLKVCEIISV